MNAALRWPFLLVVVTVIWGWSFVAIHQATDDLAANNLNFLRFFIATCSLVPFAFSRILRLSLVQVLYACGAGIILFFAYYFQTAGIALTTPSNAGFITGMAVIFTPLFAFFLKGTLASQAQLIGAVVAIGGLALLTLGELEIRQGDLLVLAGAAFVGLHIVVLSTAAARTDALALATIQVAVVAVSSYVAGLLEGERLVLPTSDNIISMLILGSFGTAAAYFIQTKAQQFISPPNIALILLLEPVFGGLFGYFLAGDAFTYMRLLGAVLVIGGVAIGECGAHVRRVPVQPSTPFKGN